MQDIANQVQTLEPKNPIAEMQDSLDGFDSRMEMTEESQETDGKSVESIQYEWEKKI